MKILIRRINQLEEIKTILGDKYDSAEFFAGELVGIYTNEDLRQSEIRAIEKILQKIGCVAEAVDPEQLQTLQFALIERVDVECESRIHDGPGFEYPADSGLLFSMSANAQTTWSGRYADKDTQAYPFTVRTKDDLSTWEVTGALTVSQMWGALQQTRQAYINACTTAKTAILAAQTEAEAQAAHDDYMVS